MNSQVLLKILAEEVGLTAKLYSNNRWVKISYESVRSSSHIQITGSILEYLTRHKSQKSKNDRRWHVIDLHDPDSISKIRTYFKSLSSELLEWDKHIEQLEAQNGSGN